MCCCWVTCFNILESVIVKKLGVIFVENIRNKIFFFFNFSFNYLYFLDSENNLSSILFFSGVSAIYVFKI